MRPEPSGAAHHKPIDWLRYRRRPSGFAYVGCGRRSVWHVARTVDADMWTLEEMPNHHPGCWFVAGTYPTAAAARSNAEGADGRGSVGCSSCERLGHSLSYHTGSDWMVSRYP